ncbi:50S ribosomal protein L11 methyltransferase [Calothrix sp. 336/3]|uniref:50S ribosomal protein L11 methyltransferase n=1 Tax=Calothrix sp. 336/3 TaxID=1337936 RepID=UPI0004E3CEF6|nr:50S ribosomal protein L11 methyltransferase [Calothrix sp. 336/3]AKG23804.1 50S ribosomal protein L11 methyltransferase [Calothrix sp. 336/3]
MSFVELSLHTTDEAVDWVCTILADTNYISDITVTPWADASQPEWTHRICWYIPDDMQSNSRTEAISHVLAGLQRTGLSTDLQMAVVTEKVIPETDAVIRVGDRLIIITNDVIPPDITQENIILKLKTTLAFGSGLHPATVLALKLVEKYVSPGMHALDLGSGSGILSVAIAKLGATVLALDNDPVAVQSTQEAVQRNQLESQVTVMGGSLGCGSQMGHWMGGNTIADVSVITPQEDFDLIVGNVFGRIHLALVADYYKALRSTHGQDGILIISGFTTEYEDNLITSLTEAGFRVIGYENCDDWVAIAFAKNNILSH